ncbi:MAG: HisA/HisF-related TIM barrel protein [Chloroflexota bacterium]|nr:HisA/HisF-related TIM barrel protein [Chloroflexota bacterium]
MKLIPSLDVQAGRSRLVFWPGAAAGSGTPTDRPERIARHFVELGATQVHLVDLDGARRGVPANTDVIQRVAREVAVPLQLAGGVDGPDQIELAFACGATRVVVPMWAVADSLDTLRACVRAAGDWLAVGLDGRPERLREYPWTHGPAPSLDELVKRLAGEGVRRVVLSHWQYDEIDRLLSPLAAHDVEVQLAGGLSDGSLLPMLRDAGISGVLLGEALFTGAIDYSAATKLLSAVNSRGTID